MKVSGLEFSQPKLREVEVGDILQSNLDGSIWVVTNAQHTTKFDGLCLYPALGGYEVGFRLSRMSMGEYRQFVGILFVLPQGE